MCRLPSPMISSRATALLDRRDLATLAKAFRGELLALGHGQ